MRCSWHDTADEVLGAGGPDIVLLVLTMHGRRLELQMAISDRTAEQVIAATDRAPVLLIRPEAGHARPLKRLLVPLTGTPSTAAAVGPDGTRRPNWLRPRFDLLYVAGPTQDRPDERGGMGAPQYVDQAHQSGRTGSRR